MNLRIVFHPKSQKPAAVASMPVAQGVAGGAGQGNGSCASHTFHVLS